MEERKPTKIKIEPMMISRSPTIDDLVGTARDFANDLKVAIEGEAIFGAMGVKADKSFLLYGPPATGKTMSVQALNNTLNADFFNEIQESKKQVDEEGNLTVSMDKYKLMVYPYDIGKYGTAYINRGSKIVQRFFDYIGIQARYGQKCLVFLDEADSLLINRTGGLQSHSEDRKILETIMKNLQAIHDVPNMYAVLATNLVDGCDDAALRAGRIDRRYKFDVPSKEQREKAFELVINEVNHNAGYKVVRNYNLGQLAQKTDKFNYADIRAVIEGTVRDRAVELIKDKTKGIIPAAYVTQSRLEKTLTEQKKNYHKKVKRVEGFGR